MQKLIVFSFNRCNRTVVMALLLMLNLMLLTACSSGVSVDTGTNNSNNSNGVSKSKAVKPSLVASITATHPPVNTSGKKVGPSTIYPNPNLTPGDALPGVTAQEVCVAGYSTSVRNVTAEEKAAVYQRYGVQNVTGRDEVDHFISLELGGSNNLNNLWPEPYAPPPGAHEKDKVENALHAAVCAGKMTLPEAQRIITQDWYAYYLQIGSVTPKK